MATFTSSTRITGLNSGLDVDSLVDQMISAESSKYKNLQRKSQKVTWQQEAYRDIISKLQTFQNKWFGTSQSSTNFRYSTAFQNFQNTVMNADNTESKAITVNSSKSDVNYDIEVIQLAKADVYVSSPNGGEKTVTSSKSLSDVASTITENTPLKFSLNLDGVTKNIEVTKSELDAASGSLADVLNEELENAFGSVNGEKKVSLVDNGTSFSFKINVDGGDGHVLKVNEGETREVQSVTSEIFKIEDLAKDVGEDGKLYKLNVNGNDIEVKIEEGETNDSLVSKINTALSEAGLNGVSVGLVSEAQKDAEGNTVTDNAGNTVKDYKLEFKSTNYEEDITIKAADADSLVSFAQDADGTLEHIGSLKDLGFSADQSTAMNSTGKTVGELLNVSGTYQISVNGTAVSLDSSDSIDTMVSKINAVDGVKMSYNSVTNAFKLQADETGASNKIQFDANGENLMNKLGFDLSKSTAQDAIVEIDGVRTTRSSNEVDIDGLNITLNAETEGVVTVKSTYDTKAMVDKIKSFVEEYNTLIGDLNKQIKQTKAKSGSKGNYSYYEPLLDEEKKEMSEDEIEKWEAKAKEGLLYNDSAISSLLSGMRSALYNTVTTSDGSKMSLFSIGITTTSDYTQGGKLVIDEAKLTEAIKANGDAIQEMFTQTETGLGDTVNKILNNAVGSNGSLRNKAGIVGTSSVSENVLSKQLKSINEQIDKERVRLANKENHYYQLFAAMESAVSNSNSQLDSLYSMLG